MGNAWTIEGEQKLLACAEMRLRGGRGNFVGLPLELVEVESVAIEKGVLLFAVGVGVLKYTITRKAEILCHALSSWCRL